MFNDLTNLAETMGKKLKGGRRQILQLEEKKPPKTVSKPKMKNLIHYSDSDDDSKKSNESESSTKLQSTKDATPMDSEIADFFKEIDALSVPEELCEPSNPSPIENETAKPDNSDDPNSVRQNEDTDLPQNKVDCPVEEHREEIVCSWQEIPDESTGYSYYWNMHTNEVTWDCPEEYANYVLAMNAKLQAESNEANSKKAKRKKEPEKLPEGAIIPISYYGSSSSDNSSGSENESPKPSKKQKIEQPVIPKKTKVSHKKKDRRKNSKKTDIIGPQLPTDFQLEPSENVVYGPSLPPNYGEILRENTLSVAMDASLPETSNKTSLKSASKSTNVKEIGSLPLHKASNSVSLKSTAAYGLKAVVDYGSFTDEEEDEDDDDESNNATSPKDTEKLVPETTIEENNINMEIEIPVTKLKKEDTDKKSVSTIEAPTKIDKPNTTSDSKESLKKLKNLDSLPKDTKRTDVDIDGIFAAHSSYGKHGFGFGFREHSDEETEVSSPSRQERKSYRSQTDIKPLSFVKSSSVLELGSLNQVAELQTVKYDLDDKVPPEDCRTLDPEEAGDQLSSKDTSEDLIEKSTESHSRVKDELYEGQSTVAEETSEDCLKVTEDDVQMHSDEEAEVKKVDSNEECPDEVLKVKEDIVAEDSKIDDQKELGECSSSDSSSFFELTDDLDEIDKALCEALDKKKAKDKASIPPDTTSTEIKYSKIDSYDVKPLPKLQKSVEESKLKPKEDSALKARITEMANVLTDKLTFLLSNSTTTLQSLNSLYIQLQTRFIDWQASALDSAYFEARLKEVDTYLHQYETGVVSGNWTCQWDRYGHILSFCPNPSPSYELLNLSHLYLYIRIIIASTDPELSSIFQFGDERSSETIAVDGCQNWVPQEVNTKTYEAYSVGFKTFFVNISTKLEFNIVANKRYFYSNILTRVTQWTFPEELLCPETPLSDSPKVDHTDTAEKNGILQTTASNKDFKGIMNLMSNVCRNVYFGVFQSSEHFDLVSGLDLPMSITGLFLRNCCVQRHPCPILQRCCISPTPSPWRGFPLSTPPPPPPSPPLSSNTPPCPPLSVTEREPEDMDLEDSSDSSLPGMSPVPTFVQTNASIFSSVSSPTTKPRTLFPILATDNDAKPTGNISVPEFPPSTHPTVSRENILTAVSSSLEVSAAAEAGSTQQKAAVKPAKKKKTKIQPGLGLRKKNIPSLVEKWQKIKEEQDRESSQSNEPKPPF
ncbi:hypothetical protein JTE90_025104 [Oedothorax gibbosus]|uniref:WW domain-containing protein n=1 Tax=Oedothorax gibbosus TaxID=931172 RepID=A0AAV6U318_9ARAC|nr:hypothetical protein JTE90_025104 [Oedothorax gibbosus]